MGQHSTSTQTEGEGERFTLGIFQIYVKWMLLWTEKHVRNIGVKGKENKILWNFATTKLRNFKCTWWPVSPMLRSLVILCDSLSVTSENKKAKWVIKNISYKSLFFPLKSLSFPLDLKYCGLPVNRHLVMSQNIQYSSYNKKSTNEMKETKRLSFCCLLSSAERGLTLQIIFFGCNISFAQQQAEST